MIPQRNISLIANKLVTAGGRRIPEAVIERDYLLAWFLTGLAGHPLREVLAFKGGTALRRCWFEDYRLRASTAASTARQIDLAIQSIVEYNLSTTKRNIPAVPPSSHPQRILALAREKGMLRASDLQTLGTPRVALTRLATSGQLERVGHGLYRLPNADTSEHEGLVSIAVKVPQAVFCLLTALQFHELTTQLPRRVWIAMPRGSHTPRIDHPPIKMVQFTGEGYSEGIEVFERDGVQLRVYGVAKTVADCFKHRNKIGLDVALEALKDAVAQRKSSADDLWRYAKICRVANVMRPYLEAVT